MRECLSCGRELPKPIIAGVPSGVDCCFRCWHRVPIAERLKISIAVRDRQFGGVLSELASVAGAFQEIQKRELDS